MIDFFTRPMELPAYVVYFIGYILLRKLFSGPKRNYVNSIYRGDLTHLIIVHNGEVLFHTVFPVMQKFVNVINETIHRGPFKNLISLPETKYFLFNHSELIKNKGSAIFQVVGNKVMSIEKYDEDVNVAYEYVLAINKKHDL